MKQNVKYVTVCKDRWTLKERCWMQRYLGFWQVKCHILHYTPHKVKRSRTKASYTPSVPKQIEIIKGRRWGKKCHYLSTEGKMNERKTILACYLKAGELSIMLPPVKNNNHQQQISKFLKLFSQLNKNTLLQIDYLFNKTGNTTKKVLPQRNTLTVWTILFLYFLFYI